MDKVKVTREVAEAFEHLKKLRRYISDNDILIEHIEKYQNDGWFGKLKPLNNVEPLTLAKMFEGYEIEPTPQEMLVQYVRENERLANVSRLITDIERAKGRLEGVAIALELLNIKVSGINTGRG